MVKASDRNLYNILINRVIAIAISTRRCIACNVPVSVGYQALRAINYLVVSDIRLIINILLWFIYLL